MPSHVDIWFGGLRSDSVTDTASYEFSMPARQLVPVCSSSHQSIIKVRFAEKNLHIAKNNKKTHSYRKICKTVWRKRGGVNSWSANARRTESLRGTDGHCTSAGKILETLTWQYIYMTQYIYNYIYTNMTLYIYLSIHYIYIYVFVYIVTIFPRWCHWYQHSLHNAI